MYPTYQSVDAFYEAQGGRASGECMFGVHHYNDLPVGPTSNPQTPIARLPPWEVNVVEDTGCVYAQTLGTAGKGGAVVLLGKVAAGDRYADAEQRFAGWSETARRPLSWFARRSIPVDQPAPVATDYNDEDEA